MLLPTGWLKLLSVILLLLLPVNQKLWRKEIRKDIRAHMHCTGKRSWPYRQEAGAARWPSQWPSHSLTGPLTGPLTGLT